MTTPDDTSDNEITFIVQSTLRAPFLITEDEQALKQQANLHVDVGIRKHKHCIKFVVDNATIH